MATVTVHNHKRKEVYVDKATGKLKAKIKTSPHWLTHFDVRTLMEHAGKGGHDGILQESPNATVEVDAGDGSPVVAMTLAEYVAKCKDPKNIPPAPKATTSVAVQPPTHDQMTAALTAAEAEFAASNPTTAVPPVAPTSIPAPTQA